jgi:hypothetical protein
VASLPVTVIAGVDRVVRGGGASRDWRRVVGVTRSPSTPGCCGSVRECLRWGCPGYLRRSRTSGDPGRLRRRVRSYARAHPPPPVTATASTSTGTSPASASPAARGANGWSGGWARRLFSLAVPADELGVGSGNRRFPDLGAAAHDRRHGRMAAAHAIPVLCRWRVGGGLSIIGVTRARRDGGRRG